MKQWYAVQETPDDDWDWGSYDFEKAKEMLREQGCGLIAVIDVTDNDPLCIEEITYEKLFG